MRPARELISRCLVFLTALVLTGVPMLLLAWGLSWLMGGAYRENTGRTFYIFATLSTLAALYHAWALPKGWQRYYNRWGLSRKLEIGLPKEQFAEAWPRIKAQLRKLNYEVHKERGNNRFVFHKSTGPYFSKTATLDIFPLEGEMKIQLCTNKLDRYVATPDFGAKMAVMQAIERGIAGTAGYVTL
ncbi:MAG: hypothetical protein KF690_07385 [Bacteroidetes bacterium]|nr:hypothetical protein [Bacteroidota bacterium]